MHMEKVDLLTAHQLGVLGSADSECATVELLCVDSSGAWG